MLNAGTAVNISGLFSELAEAIPNSNFDFLQSGSSLPVFGDELPLPFLALLSSVALPLLISSLVRFRGTDIHGAEHGFSKEFIGVSTLAAGTISAPIMDASVGAGKSVGVSVSSRLISSALISVGVGVLAPLNASAGAAGVSVADAGDAKDVVFSLGGKVVGDPELVRVTLLIPMGGLGTE